MYVQAKGSGELRASRSWRGREAPLSPQRVTTVGFCLHSCGHSFLLLEATHWCYCVTSASARARSSQGHGIPRRRGW